MAKNKEVIAGVRNAVRNCMKVKAGERVVILGDNKTKDIVKLFKKEVESVTQEVVVFVLEDFGKRPLRELPEEISERMREADASFYMAHSASFDGGSELDSVIKPLKEIVYSCRGRHAHMPNLVSEIVEVGLNTDPVKVNEFTEKVYDFVREAKEIEVKTERGTSLRARFDKKFKWVKCSAIPEIWDNLPGAEVFTCPAKIDGVVVIDGVLGNKFSSYGLLDKNVLRVEIENGVVANVECSNEKLGKEFFEFISMDENASRVGEFAFGTNIFLKELIGRNLQDEKFPGFHLAFGDPIGKKTNASWSSKAHVDGVVKGCTIRVDGKVLMENGEYVI